MEVTWGYGSSLGGFVSSLEGIEGKQGHLGDHLGPLEGYFEPPEFAWGQKRVIRGLWEVTWGLMEVTKGFMVDTWGP